MFGLGIPELIVICVIALLIFGPKRLPDTGKAIGQAIRDFKSSMEGKDGERSTSRTVSAATCRMREGRGIRSRALSRLRSRGEGNGRLNRRQDPSR